MTMLSRVEIDEHNRIEDAKRLSGAAIMAGAREQDCSFLTEAAVAGIATDPSPRLTLLLVRCGGCRFLAPAQDVQHLVDIITREGTDYIRDVSVPARG